MGLNDTPSGERIHIGFFGRRNAGKSSVVNAFTGQELAVVSNTLRALVVYNVINGQSGCLYGERKNQSRWI